MSDRTRLTPEQTAFLAEVDQHLAKIVADRMTESVKAVNDRDDRGHRFDVV